MTLTMRDPLINKKETKKFRENKTKLLDKMLVIKSKNTPNQLLTRKRDTLTRKLEVEREHLTDNLELEDKLLEIEKKEVLEKEMKLREIQLIMLTKLLKKFNRKVKKKLSNQRLKLLMNTSKEKIISLFSNKLKRKSNRRKELRKERLTY